MKKTWAVFLREARTELRSRYALNAIGMFALTTLMVVGFSVGANISHKTQAALLWLILLFSAMTGLSRSFVREVESRTQDTLRLSADPTALLFGKALFNGALLAGVQVIVTPLFALMVDMPVRSLGFLVTILVLGNLGLTIASTILAVLVARAGGRTALFPVLALPLLIPLLMALVAGTYAALVPDMARGLAIPNPIEARVSAWEAGRPYFQIAVAYAGMLGPASMILFDFIWSD